MNDFTLCSQFIANKSKNYNIIRFQFFFRFCYTYIFCVVFGVLFVKIELNLIIESSNPTTCNSKNKLCIDSMSYMKICLWDNMRFHVL